MNVVLLVGNLTRDPEMRYTPGGKAVTEFTVAVNEGFGEKRTVTFIRCQAWEKLAEFIAERARKGTKVAVDGRITIDRFKDKMTQQNREMMRINCRGVDLLSRTEPTGEPRQPTPVQSDGEEIDEEDLRDLPF